MKEFKGFGSFGKFLTTLAIAEVIEHEMLEKACVEVEKKAKEKIGEYQPAAGPFAAWAPLSPATIDDRVYSGYSADNPLLRTGDMRDSIEHKVIGNEHIGSDSDVAYWQELGTEKIPARSFLGGAAFELAPLISREIGVEYVAFLSGGGKRIAVR